MSETSARITSNRARKSGMSLGTLILLLLVVVTLLFTAASTSMFHLNYSVGLENRDQARNLADSALAQAMAQMANSDFSFGQNSGDRVQVDPDFLDDSEGIVTFDTGELSRGYSTYNLNNDASVIGANGRIVPGRTIHLVARGRVRDTVRWSECLYYRPPFPDGLVCSGRVDASGLLLAAVRNGQDYPGGDPNSIPAANQLPGNLFSNDATSNAVVLGPDCRISGSLGAVGGIQVDPGSVVLGEAAPGSAARTIPDLGVRAKIANFDQNSTELGASHTGSLTLPDHWFARCMSDMAINSDLNLDYSVLTVRGDLTIGGAITGTGAILVDGDVTVQDGTALLSENQIALVATGKILLRSSDRSTNYFQGLVYAEDDITAREITVVGTLVANGQSPGEGEVELENVTLVQAPTSVSIIAGTPPTPPATRNALTCHLLIREAPDGQVLYDMRGYFTDGDDGFTLPPSQWIGLENYQTRAWTGLTRDQLASTLLDWVRSVDQGNEAVRSSEVATFHSWLDGYVDSLNTLQPPDGVSFHLNNLMPEAIERSRVLLWGDYQP